MTTTIPYLDCIVIWLLRILVYNCSSLFVIDIKNTRTDINLQTCVGLFLRTRMKGETCSFDMKLLAVLIFCLCYTASGNEDALTEVETTVRRSENFV